MPPDRGTTQAEQCVCVSVSVSVCLCVCHGPPMAIRKQPKESVLASYLICDRLSVVSSLCMPG